MDPMVATLLPVIAEALKVWGVFSCLLLAVGAAYWKVERRCRERDSEIKELRAEIARLQDLRLQDAREMIRVAETGTATMAARAQGDANLRDLLGGLGAVLARLQQAGAIPLPPPLPPGSP